MVYDPQRRAARLHGIVRYGRAGHNRMWAEVQDGYPAEGVRVGSVFVACLQGERFGEFGRWVRLATSAMAATEPERGA